MVHAGHKAILASIRPNHNAYQRFNIVCAEGRRFSYYNRICQFSVTWILSIYCDAFNLQRAYFSQLPSSKRMPLSITSLFYPSVKYLHHGTHCHIAIWIMFASSKAIQLCENPPHKTGVDRNCHLTVPNSEIILPPSEHLNLVGYIVYPQELKEPCFICLPV